MQKQARYSPEVIERAVRMVNASNAHTNRPPPKPGQLNSALGWAWRRIRHPFNTSTGLTPITGAQNGLSCQLNSERGSVQVVRDEGVFLKLLPQVQAGKP
jgi:hypothetical protein